MKSFNSFTSIVFGILIFSLSNIPKLAHAEDLLDKIEATAKPNAYHTLLAPLAGDWAVKIKVWIDPKNNPEVLSGRASVKYILGGRFLEQKIETKGSAYPYEGKGILGYNKSLDQYVGTWIDTSNTGIFQYEGTINDSKEVFTLEGKFIDPILNAVRIRKLVITLIDPDNYLTETFTIDPEDKNRETKVAQINYSRILEQLK